MHRHLRAQLIYAGNGVIRVETAAGCWVVPPLRAVWIPAGIDHKVSMLGAVEMRTVYVRPGAAPTLPTACCLILVSPLLRELILALQQEPVNYDLAGRGGLIAQLLLTELCFLQTPDLHLPMPTDARLLKLCRQLLATPEKDVTLDRLAERIAVSPRTLARLFLRETGMSFRLWRQQARLIEALGRLGSGESVAQVARHTGYANPSAFTAMFRRALGCEPSRYF